MHMHGITMACRRSISEAGGYGHWARLLRTCGRCIDTWHRSSRGHWRSQDAVGNISCFANRWLLCLNARCCLPTASVPECIPATLKP